MFCRNDGASVGDFKKAWATACIEAGLFKVVPAGEPNDGEPQKTRKVPTKIFHDTRRSAVRGLERAGVPRSAAMKMTGHKTESIYRRYAIVDETRVAGSTPARRTSKFFEHLHRFVAPVYCLP